MEVGSLTSFAPPRRQDPAAMDCFELRRCPTLYDPFKPRPAVVGFAGLVIGAADDDVLGGAAAVLESRGPNASNSSTWSNGRLFLGASGRKSAARCTATNAAAPRAAVGAREAR